MKDKKPKYTPPKNLLKQKMGDGGIPNHLLDRSQKYLETNPIDFSPNIATYIRQINEITRQVESNAIDLTTALAASLDIVMQLKANGSMFHYQLVSMISDVLQRFVEKIKIPQPDVLDIITIYIKILNIILSKNLKGNGGKEGLALTKELENACERYFLKHDIS